MRSHSLRILMTAPQAVPFVARAPT
jgi:hypothetical protein